MGALRLLPRAEWEARLRELGCAPLSGKGPLNTAEWWHAPWLGPFAVPVEDNGACDEASFWRLYADLVSRKPRGGHKT